MEPTPVPIPPKTPELEALFNLHVPPPDPITGCQWWTGHKYPTGYGRIYVPGLRRSFRAHRVIYAWTYGDTEDILDHLCHKPLLCVLDQNGWCPHRSCVNPLHLEATTRGENVRRGLPGSPLWNPAGNSYKKLSDSGREFDYVDPRGWRGSRKDRREAVARYRDSNRDAINAKRRAEREHITYERRPCPKCGTIYQPYRSDSRYCTTRDCINQRQRENRDKRLGL